MNRMNKKGEEKLLSMWDFVVWALITATLVLGLSMYGSYSVDTTKYEEKMVAEKIMGCVVQGGYLNNDFFTENYSVELCGLTKEVLDLSGNYFIGVKYVDLMDSNEVQYSKKIGNGEFEMFCILKTKSKFPDCTSWKFYVYDNINKKDGIVEIMVGIRDSGGKL